MLSRVRCDLKDLPDSKICSNCQEHGFNCVWVANSAAPDDSWQLIRIPAMSIEISKLSNIFDVADEYSKSSGSLPIVVMDKSATDHSEPYTEVAHLQNASTMTLSRGHPMVLVLQTRALSRG